MDFSDLLEQADGLSLDLLGEPVTVTPDAGSPESVAGIFDKTFEHVDGGTPGFTSTGPVLSFRLDALPVDPETAEVSFTVDGVTYRGSEFQKDGKGWIRILLHKVL